MVRALLPVVRVLRRPHRRPTPARRGGDRHPCGGASGPRAVRPTRYQWRAPRNGASFFLFLLLLIVEWTYGLWERHFARDHNHQTQTIIDPFVDEVVTFVTTMSKQLYKCAHPCGWYHIHIPTHTQHPHTHRLLVPEPPPSIFGSGRTPGGLSASRTNGLLYPNAHSQHTPQHLLYYYSPGRCFA
jgi:hypothetical protein